MSTPEDQPGEALLDPEGIASAIASLADEIAADFDGAPPVFIGIYTRGVTLAQRVARRLAERGIDPGPVGTLDVSLYRDDFVERGNALPSLETSELPLAIDGADVILFDEVVYTGRTVRAALNGLMDYGRPARVQLASLVDRGWRELPIRPDYVGLAVETGPDDYVRVLFAENDDGAEGVYLVKDGANATPGTPPKA